MKIFEIIILVLLVSIFIFALINDKGNDWNLTLMNGEQITVHCDVYSQVISQTGYLEYRCGSERYMVTHAEKVK